MNALKQTIQFSILIFLLTGCSPQVVIRPPPTAMKISELCIINNPKVLMDGFLPELKKQIRGYGIKTQTWTAYNPDGCRYWLDYTANWRWNFTLILSYAELTLYDRTTPIGSALFDSQPPQLVYYYGSAAKKLKELTGPLFAQQ